jgi:hypothetical protein
VTGDVHGPFGPSSQHSNVEPGTSELNVKVTLEASLGSSGPETTVVTGGGATVHR